MLIGITGKKQSGKDTVAKIIQLIHNGYNRESVKQAYEHNEQDLYKGYAKIASFAKPIKEIVEYIFNWNSGILDNNYFKESPIEKLSQYEVVINNRFNDKFKIPKDTYFKLKLEGVNEVQMTRVDITPRQILQIVGTDMGRNMIHPDIWVDYLFSTYERHLNHLIISDVRFENEASRIIKEKGIIIEVINPDQLDLDKHESENQDLSKYVKYTIINDKDKGIDNLVDEVFNILESIIKSK